ncbi:MAG: ABC transporter permease subunit [Candidatus Saganbacteria bacterium]|nr:ABC transporter permease subunit [Candidatus Saganbacteria bacterium]
MQISYYLKQKIIHQITNVIMILFLIITLFPIVWMAYSSIKENTDILSGKVALSKAENRTKFIQLDGPNIYFCTQDGGVNKFKLKDLSRDGYVSTQTMATNFAVDEKYVWVSSANRGLLKFDKENLKKVKEYKLPFKDIDISKVAGTIILNDGNAFWYSIHYRGFEGIMKFDKQKGTFSEIYELANELSPIQVIRIFKQGEVLWISTNKGLLKFDAKANKVVAATSLASYLPGGAGVLVASSGKVFLGGANGVFVFDIAAGQVVGRYQVEQGILSNQVESLISDGDQLYIGTNVGLSIINTRTNAVKNYGNLFNPVAEDKEVTKGELTAGVVAVMVKQGDKLFVGSTIGRLSEVDLATGKVLQTGVGKEGHWIIAWRNYIDMFKNINFGKYLWNSFFICGVSMFISMILATFAAYAISRFNFPGNKLFSLSILATQMVPGIMFLIPIYIMYIKFTELTGIPMKGTYFGMIFLYSAFFVPFSIWILRGFFAAIPYELEEAARIDGCSPLQVFWYVVLPLAMPGIIATGIYIFLTAWDELMFAWILTSGDTMTIPVGIRLFVGNYQNRFDLMMAAATVATIPVMVLFFMLQKHIVQGLTAGAVKG